MTATGASAPLRDPRPPGWSYNPSARRERRLVVAAAVLGFAIAVYLTLYQVGALADVWDPLFGPASSRAVLHSALARHLPFPDAALGALAYLVEAVAAGAGGDDRWRTRPWIVLVYGATALGLGVVSTVPVILQPVLSEAWCALCLASALISMNLVGPALGETLATLQEVRRAADRGRPLARVLFGEAQHGRAA